MKYFLATLPILLLLTSYQVRSEGEKTDEKDAATIVETQNTNVFKGVLYQIWNKVRRLSPKANANASSRNRVVATAGVRGSETTSSLLQPYWKDDRTNDEQFLKELESLNGAQTLIDQGELQQSKAALDKFLSVYSESVLKSNAQFTKAMVLGGLGESQESIAAFKLFVKDNPKHPLAEDAKVVIAELSK